MLSQQSIEDIATRLAARLGAGQVIVFGSYAKGCATHHSDLDLFVVADTNLPRAQRTAPVDAMLSGLLIPVDVHVYTPEEMAAYTADDTSFVSTVLRSGWTVLPRGQH